MQILRTGYRYAKNFDSEADAIEWASRHCNCRKSCAYAYVEQAKETAEMQLADEDVEMTVVAHCIEDIGYNRAESISVKFEGSASIKINRNSSGEISVKVKKTQTNQLTL